MTISDLPGLPERTEAEYEHQRQAQLKILDFLIARGAEAKADALATIRNPQAREVEVIRARGALGSISPRLADERYLAAGLRSGELDPWDDALIDLFGTDLLP